MDPLANAYLKIITESEDLQKGQDVKGETSQTGKVFGNAESEKNKAPQKKTGPEAVDGEVESPEEAHAGLTQSAKTDGKPSKNVSAYENKNPFDLLYNKILSEEGEEMSFSTGSTPEDSSFGIAEPFGSEGSSEETDEFGEGEEDEEESVTFTLDKETAHKLISVLTAALGEEEGEEHEGEESEGEEEAEHGFGGSEEGEESEEGESENPFKEATDMEALSDEKGLTLTSKNNKVSGVNVTKKAATTPATGKGHDGKVKSQPTEGGVSKLTAKAGIKVGSVDKVGSTLFDQ